jgi:glycosyltransferase involved in cell wall biosynthesis
MVQPIKLMIPAKDIAGHQFAKVAASPKVVSIIYNYYRKIDTVLQSIQSIEQQVLEHCRLEDIEIILIDDGTQGENLPEMLPPSVLYLWQRKIGYGICRAKNTGARLANGKYLLFLDPDIMLSRGFIAGMLSGFINYGDEVAQCGYIQDYHFVGCPDPRSEFGVWEAPNRLTRRFYQIAGGNLAIAKSVYMRTPGFDEDLIYGGVEDLLFGYHLKCIPGVSVMFNRQMESRHIPHPPGGAHADVPRTWNIVKEKWPQFYDDYIVKGIR